MNIANDKFLHILVSSIITTMLGAILPTWVAVLATLGIGISKEIYDKVSGKGCFEWMDLVCDCIGVLIGVL